ncbi:MAG: hypothetical protein AAGF12_26810 [Myxococcota bacterium]
MPDARMNRDAAARPDAAVVSDAQAVPDQSTPDADLAPSESEITECSNPTVHMVNPDNFQSVASNANTGCHLFDMEPGVYSVGAGDVPRLGNVTMRCRERHECIINGWHIAHYGTLIIEGMKFGAVDNSSRNNYGLALYYGDRARLQHNVWETVNTPNQTHGISIKNTAERVEILDNSFDCLRHCIEISQNGNIRTRNSLTGTVVIRGNTFSSRNTVITNRNSCSVLIESNEFVEVGSTAVTNLAFWELYPYGASGDRGELYVPKCPYPQDQSTGTIGGLSTRLVNNHFGSGQLRFNGRGVTDDIVDLRDNTGSYTCSLSSMGSGARNATADEETSEPPRLADGSDPC